VRDGEFYVINGTKRFITNAPQAGIFTVMARTSREIKGAGGISSFIVEADTPGVTVGKRDHKMGQKGAHTADVIFENVRVPAGNLIGGKEGVGFKTAMKVLDKGRLHTRQDATDASFIDVAHDAASCFALNVDFLQNAAINVGNTGFRRCHIYQQFSRHLVPLTLAVTENDSAAHRSQPAAIPPRRDSFH